MKQDEGIIDDDVRSAKRKDDSFVQATHLLLSEITASVPDHVKKLLRSKMRRRRSNARQPKRQLTLENIMIPRVDGEDRRNREGEAGGSV